MGMTAKQFNGFIRLLLDLMENAAQETDAEEKEKKYRKIVEHLRDTLED